MVNHSELQNQRIAQIPATWAIEESPTTNHNKPNRIKPQLGTVKSCAFKFNTTQTWILKAGKQSNRGTLRWRTICSTKLDQSIEGPTRINRE